MELDPDADDAVFRERSPLPVLGKRAMGDADRQRELSLRIEELREKRQRHSAAVQNLEHEESSLLASTSGFTEMKEEWMQLDERRRENTIRYERLLKAPVIKGSEAVHEASLHALSEAIRVDDERILHLIEAGTRMAPTYEPVEHRLRAVWAEKEEHRIQAGKAHNQLKAHENEHAWLLAKECIEPFRHSGFLHGRAWDALTACAYDMLINHPENLGYVFLVNLSADFEVMCSFNQAVDDVSCPIKLLMCAKRQAGDRKRWTNAPSVRYPLRYGYGNRPLLNGSELAIDLLPHLYVLHDEVDGYEVLDEWPVAWYRPEEAQVGPKQIRPFQLV